jgi:hypothetical protein
MSATTFAASDSHMALLVSMPTAIMEARGFFWLFFWRYWSLNSGLHICYHLDHAYSPFCSVYFGDRVLLFAQDHETILRFLL